MAGVPGVARTNHEEAVEEFSSITGEKPETARSYLESTGWMMESALAAYYENGDEPEQLDEDDDSTAEDPYHEPNIQSSTAIGDSGGRRLGGDGDYVPTGPSSSSAATASSGRSKPTQRKMFGTLKDISGDGNAGSSHGHDDDEASDKEQEFYAGGDKSGLAVQDPSSANPRDQIQRLMNTARRGGPRPPRPDGAEDQASRRNYFGGTGQTLGGDEEESRIIPATENPQQRGNVEMVERILHLWQDGFSVDDGILYRYDDPANRRTLDMINAGSAPMDLMNVQNGQAVDVKLMNHPNENYVQPKKKFKAFEGSGQRLGSPTPGIAASTTPANSTTPAGSTPATSSTPSVDVDNSQPTLSIQIRLADGTRMPSRFNTTHTIGDVYDFVQRSQPGGFSSAWVLATTFPTKELTDKSQVLGDMSEFKRGGVVVQKWA